MPVVTEFGEHVDLEAVEAVQGGINLSTLVAAFASIQALVGFVTTMLYLAFLGSKVDWSTAVVVFQGGSMAIFGGFAYLAARSQRWVWSGMWAVLSISCEVLGWVLLYIVRGLGQGERSITVVLSIHGAVVLFSVITGIVVYRAVRYPVLYSCPWSPPPVLHHYRHRHHFCHQHARITNTSTTTTHTQLPSALPRTAPIRCEVILPLCVDVCAGAQEGASLPPQRRAAAARGPRRAPQSPAALAVRALRRAHQQGLQVRRRARVMHGVPCG